MSLASRGVHLDLLRAQKTKDLCVDLLYQSRHGDLRLEQLILPTRSAVT